MKNIKFVLLIILVITSCGVVLDPLRIEDEWELKGVEFYVYYNEIDSIKTYVGINDNTPDAKRPIMANFFCDDKQYTYTINFLKDKTLKIEKTHDSSTDIIVDYKDGEWSINSFDNSLTINIDGDGSSSNFWLSGFSLTNKWPLVDFNTLEIYIKATDVGKTEFLIDLESEVLKVYSMKGIFTKE